MTTSLSSSNKTQKSVPRQKKAASTREDRFDKITDTARRYAFPIFVLVAGVIAWFVLYGVGQSATEMGMFTYPSTAAVIIAWFNLVIMAYPAVLVVIKRQQALARSLIIVGSVVVTFLFLPFVFRLLSSWGTAQALWGLVIPGAVAIALHGWAAVMLARYAATDTEAQAAKDALPGLRRNADKASEEAENADKELRSLQIIYSNQEEILDKAVSRQKAKHHKLLDKIEDDMKAAASEVAVKSDKLKALETEKDEAEALIQEADKASKDVWRDIVFGPIVSLVASFVLYSAWYGWVIVEF